MYAVRPRPACCLLWPLRIPTNSWHERVSQARQTCALVPGQVNFLPASFPVDACRLPPVTANRGEIKSKSFRCLILSQKNKNYHFFCQSCFIFPYLSYFCFQDASTYPDTSYTRLLSKIKLCYSGWRHEKPFRPVFHLFDAFGERSFRAKLTDVCPQRAKPAVSIYFSIPHCPTPPTIRMKKVTDRPSFRIPWSMLPALSR